MCKVYNYTFGGRWHTPRKATLFTYIGTHVKYFQRLFINAIIDCAHHNYYINIYCDKRNTRTNTLIGPSRI